LFYTVLRLSCDLRAAWYLPKMAGTDLDRPDPASEELERRAAFSRAIARALTRIDRRIAAIKSDLARATTARESAERARLFVASAGSAPRGSRVLTAIDWGTGSAEPVEMTIDPSKGAAEQLASLFRQARRLTAAAATSEQRLRKTEMLGDALRELAAALELGEVDLADLEARALALAPRDYSRAVKAGGAATSPRVGRSAQPPYRKFLGRAGNPILVGRDAARNDELTLHVARPRDLWLHVKGWAGAHVVVPLEKGASCPAEVLVQAAHLAAHFSAARTETIVEVTYAPRRFVRKPRRSAPGAVVVDREKVLVLRKEDAIIRSLLDSEVEQ
jgi:predicted ribosome quality control (RQC) complex YloA/Tae2 family protein